MKIEARAKNCRPQFDVKVPMRDGVVLATSVFLPLTGGPYPVVLVRTAYNRNGYMDNTFPAGGIAYVVQDCRGRYDSEGSFEPFINEPADGFDTLEWIGRQPWCNGRIGMFGDSYLAAVQLAVGPMGNRFLKALNPRFMAMDCWKHAFYVDGAFSLALVWSWLVFESGTRTTRAHVMPFFDVPHLIRGLPLLTLDEASGFGPVKAYREYVTNSQFGPTWERFNYDRNYEHYTMPVLLTGGWYDNYPAAVFTAYLGLRRHAPNARLRDSHRVIIGPWPHGVNPGSQLGELDYGPDATLENDSTQRWLTCILKDGTPEQFQAAPIRIFVMGINRWRDEMEWPLARTRFTDYFLRADGVLAPGRPGAGEAPDRYVYDPADPVPTLGGNHSIGQYNPGLYEMVKPGPFDQRPVEARADVLTFTTPVLQHDTEVTGPVAMKLWASTSARDTDFVARLTDVYPDGRSINITEGVIRGRFRENVWGAPSLLEPDKPYEFTIDMQVTSNVFKAGHKIRVDITSSNFPLWSRNHNTGSDPATDTVLQSARQCIYHDEARPSRIILPIVPA